MSPGAPEEGFLRAHGFEGTDIIERWRIDFDGVKSRLDRIPESREERTGWTCRSPGAADEAQLAALFDSVPAERLHARGPEDSREGGFAPEISAVVTAGDELIGALLLRGGSSSHCHVDLCAVAPGRWSAPVATALLRRSVGEALKEGYVGAAFSTRGTEEARPVGNLLRRCGGTIRRRSLLLARGL